MPKNKSRKFLSNIGRGIGTRSNPNRADNDPNWRQSAASTSTGRRGGRGRATPTGRGGQPQNGGNRNFSNRQQSDSGNESEPSTSGSARPRSNAKNSGGGTIEQTQVKIIIETKIIANRPKVW